MIAMRSVMLKTYLSLKNYLMVRLACISMIVHNLLKFRVRHGFSSAHLLNTFRPLLLSCLCVCVPP